MDAVQWIWIAGALIAGAAVGVAGCHRVMGRSISRLNERLLRSEQARVGAVERSMQAREQIGKLNQAIDELRKQLTRRSADDERRERAARAEESLQQAAAAEKTLMLPRSSQLQAFADTQPVER